MKYRLLILITIVSTEVFAQEELTLTFNEAVKLGLKQNITIKQEQNNLIGAKSNHTESIVNYAAPRVNASVDYGRRIGNSFSEQLGIVQGKVEGLSSGAFASLTLFNGLSRYNTIKQMKSQQDAQLYNIKWTRETIINNIALQYLTALLSQELLKIAENNLEVQKQQLSRISEQVALGSLAEVEGINQEYQIKSAELQVLRAKANIRSNYAELLRLLQIDPSTTLNLIEPDWTSKLVLDDSLNLDNLISKAMKSRADYKQAQEQEMAANYRMKVVKGFYYPSLAASFSYGSAYNYIYPSPQFPEPQNRGFADQFLEDNVQRAYGVSLSIPILNGFSTRNLVTQSKINNENAALQLEQLENTVKIQVLNAYQDYKAALSDFEASKAQLEAAELSFELEKERFFLGATDLIIYAQANQNLIAAQADYAQAFYTLVFQDILLNYAVGTLSVEDIPE